MLRNTFENKALMFTPTEDAFQTLEGGRRIQIATKGVPMPRAKAVELGLLSPDPRNRRRGKAETRRQG